MEYVSGGSCEYFNSITTTSTTESPEIIELRCDFEKSFCGWSGLGWSRKSGESVSEFGVAPTSDITTQTSQGSYAFLESSSATLTSDKLTVFDFIAYKVCFEFYYILNGNADTALALDVRGETLSRNIWLRKGNQANTWSHAYVNVEFQGKDYNRFEFIGHLAENITNYVAIDEVQLLLGNECPLSTLFCDFENYNICGYTNDVNADFNWRRNKKDTLTNGTGPSFDHTYQTNEGHYMYIEATPQKNGDNALLVSPLIRLDGSSSNAACLTFWYHMYGKDIGSLFFICYDMK